MTKEDLIKIGISEENAAKAIEAYTEEMKGYVPRSRLAEEVEAKKKLDEQLKARDSQLKELEKSAGDNADLKKQIAGLQEANKQAKADFEKQVKEIRLDSAIKAAITNAHDSGLVATLIDRSKLIMADDGSLTGLKEQLDVLQKDKAFLFKPANGGGGYNPNNGNNPQKNPFAKDTFNLTEQGKLFKENPEQARAMASAAGITI